MASNKAKLKKERNRVWGWPLAAASVTSIIFVARGGSFGTLPMLTEAALAATGGFLLAVATVMRKEARAGKPVRKNKAKRSVQVELNESDINVLRSELTALRASLKDYIAAKRAEGVKIHGAIVDLNNDVASLKETDPAEKLRPQLQVIAQKFGELSDVRRIVQTLSGKMKRVEALAGQVAEVEARIQKQSKTGDNSAVQGWNNWMGKVRRELSGMWKQVGTELRQDVIRETEEHVDRQIDEVLERKLAKRRSLRESERASIINEVRSEISGRVNARVERLFQGANVSSVVSQMANAQEERIKTMNSRMATMASEMAKLQTQISKMQEGVPAERGISVVLEEEGNYLNKRAKGLSARVGRLLSFNRRDGEREAA
ncbi:MAG: hypothetical protein KDB07_01280 [Planctomycetes bacterium]|nr:hypothetical protein [Planctomycetota bacterium]